MPHKTLAGKVALVTGGSGGVGRGIALRLSRDGAAVLISGLGDAAQDKQVVNQIEMMGGRAMALQADVSCLLEGDCLFHATLRHLGRLDILVNHAGILWPEGMTDTTEEEYARLLGIHAVSTFVACRQAVAHMAEGGRIINFSSSLTALIMPPSSDPRPRMGGIEHITQILAKQLGPRKITVNCIVLDTTDTDLPAQGGTQEQSQRRVQLAALEHLDQPEDIADVTAMLASDDARGITGQIIRANMGSTQRWECSGNGVNSRRMVPSGTPG